jgi:hypothetical protein
MNSGQIAASLQASVSSVAGEGGEGEEVGSDFSPCLSAREPLGPQAASWVGTISGWGFSNPGRSHVSLLKQGHVSLLKQGSFKNCVRTAEDMNPPTQTRSQAQGEDGKRTPTSKEGCCVSLPVPTLFSSPEKVERLIPVLSPLYKRGNSETPCPGHL